ncbi:hypothetical protein BDZ90DRAFT_234043 [Jaminaea rosea]|uniref:Sin1 middle CRIM domain-containing protein n=1 Tax=Jaminaea rosea TaxID=1569628 RepID=A0A316UNW9_9BASI|nr:hypothetical protein BDZ90DRAFT_234043 [Jaminaea rosea]PWN25603.1 hypothetical protein BDZ90DRAFT_234043 [Jaminaea rosea]
MSILRDADWSIQQLRLAYLRRIDDHHGARVISFPSHDRDRAYIDSDAGPPMGDNAVASSSKMTLADADTHVALGRLNDSAKFPEIATAYSPIISSQPLGPPGRGKRGAPLPFTLSRTASNNRRLRQGPGVATTTTTTTPSAQRDADPTAKRHSSLRYTQTIYPAGRTGALGIRVNAKRAPSLRDSSTAPKRHPRRGTDSIVPGSLGGGGIRGRHSLDESGKTPPQLYVSSSTAESRPRLLSDVGMRGARGRNQPLGAEASSSGTETDVFEEESSPRQAPSPLPPPTQSMTRTTSAGAVSPSLEPPTSPLGQRRRSATIDDSSTPANIRLGVLPATPTDPRPFALQSGQSKVNPAAPSGSMHDFSRPYTPSIPAKNPLRHLQSDSSLSSLVSSAAAGDESVENSPRPTPKELPLEGSSGVEASASSSRTLSPPARRPSWTILGASSGSQAGARSLPHSARRMSDGAVPGRTPSPLGRREEHSGETIIAEGEEEDSELEAIREQRGEDGTGSTSQSASDGPARIPRVRIDTRARNDGHEDGHGTKRSGRSKASRSKQRSRSRRPSHGRAPSPILSPEEQERQQNAWFRSLSLSPHEVATRSAANSVPLDRRGSNTGSIGPMSPERPSAALSPQPKPSALSLLLQRQNSAPENPFSQFYAGISGRSAAGGAAGSLSVDVYFPWSEGGDDAAKGGSDGATAGNGALRSKSSSRCLTLSVRKDATMEELIGYGLYCYWEAGWSPRLEDKASTSGGPQEIVLSTIGWVLRIVEDGEVDDDYPSLDRGLTVGRFGGDEFAIVEASQQQVRQHAATFDAILRRATRVVGGTGAGGTAGNAAAVGAGAGTAGVPANMAGSAYPRTLKPSTAAAATLAGTTLAPPGARLGGGLTSPTSLAPQHNNNLAPPGGGATLGRTAPNAPAFPGSPNTAVPSASAMPSATVSSLAAGGGPLGSTGPGSAAGGIGPSYYGNAPSIFLRILITPNDEVRYKTTLSVPEDMYLADVLELVCRRRQLGKADEWALVVPRESAAAALAGGGGLSGSVTAAGPDASAGENIVVPLDRTVESLQGSHDLVLVRRASLGAQGGLAALASQSTNPNASIFRNPILGGSIAGGGEQGAGSGTLGSSGLVAGGELSRDGRLTSKGSGTPRGAGAGGGLGPSASGSTLSSSSTATGMSSANLAHLLLAGSGSNYYRSWTVSRRLPPMFARGRNALPSGASSRLLHHAGGTTTHGHSTSHHHHNQQHERTLTIDGDWIHLIPTDAASNAGDGSGYGGRLLFGGGTSSSHAAASFSVGDVAGCRLSSAAAAAVAARSEGGDVSATTAGGDDAAGALSPSTSHHPLPAGSTHFKLTVALKSGGSGGTGSVGRQQKRFDLEAEDTRQAAEIVREINARRSRWGGGM